MSTSITSQDILADIEFELAQGAISRDELGRSILAIREYQNKLRGELLQPEQRDSDLHEALARQFQINDMLLTLLQETNASIQELKLQVRRTRELAPRPPAPRSFQATDEDDLHNDNQWREADSIRQAVATSLEPELELRTTPVPLAGAFLQRLRHAAHMLVLFYVRRLGNKQEKVNRTLGDWILYQDSLHRYHAEENARLRRYLAAVEQRLEKLETTKQE